MRSLADVIDQEETTRKRIVPDIDKSQVRQINSRLSFLKDARMALERGATLENLEKQAAVLKVKLERFESAKKAILPSIDRKGALYSKIVKELKKEHGYDTLTAQRTMLSFLLERQV